MAERICRYRFNSAQDCIGLYVYTPYESHRIGKIVGVKDPVVWQFIVHWEKPKAGQNNTVEFGNHLNDYEHLIADHKKKLDTHTRRLEEAKKVL